MAPHSNHFDMLFNDVLTPKEGAFFAQARVQQDSAATGTNIPAEWEAQIQDALCLFAEGRYERCSELLGKLDGDLESEPRIAALIAACQAFECGRLRPAIETCSRILETALYLPDLYLVLGVLLLRSRKRLEAHVVFRRGLQLNPRHAFLRACIRGMGRRRSPVIRSLPRSHPANRFLGLVRARMLPS